MVLEQLIFVVLAVLSIGSAIGMILMKDPVHSALLLVFTFFNIAATYILLAAEFVAVIQVLVYAGAIVVLFLFVMMLLQVRPGPSLNPLRFFQSGIGPILAVGFLVEVVLVVFASGFVLNGGKITDANNKQAAQMQASVQYVAETKIPLQDANGNTVGGTSGIGIPDVIKTDASGKVIQRTSVTGGHTALLGKELYSTYLYPFEIASLILLIAAIGAIVIARRNLEFDRDEEGKIVGAHGISLASAVHGSRQDLEARKANRVAAAQDRKITLNKK
jgi:NADH-quinone oxidoreductase subunit J